MEREVFCSFNVSHYDKGIRVTIKSEILEEFFKKKAGDFKETELISVLQKPWNKFKAYPMKDAESLEAFNKWGGSFYDNSANLSMFRAVGLKDGLTFEFEEMHSKNRLESWLTEARDELNKLYEDFMKRKDWVMVIGLVNQV